MQKGKNTTTALFIAGLSVLASMDDIELTRLK